MVNKPVAWDQIRVSFIASRFVQYDQAATVSTTKGSVNFHPVLAHVDGDVVGGLPFKLKSNVFGTDAVNILTSADIADKAVTFAPAKVHAAI